MVSQWHSGQHSSYTTILLQPEYYPTTSVSLQSYYQRLNTILLPASYVTDRVVAHIEPERRAYRDPRLLQDNYYYTAVLLLYYYPATLRLPASHVADRVVAHVEPERRDHSDPRRCEADPEAAGTAEALRAGSGERGEGCGRRGEGVSVIRAAEAGRVAGGGCVRDRCQVAVSAGRVGRGEVCVPGTLMMFGGVGRGLGRGCAAWRRGVAARGVGWEGGGGLGIVVK